jgi:hypothetical protein
MPPMYNLLSGRLVVKNWMVAIALSSLAGVAWAAPDQLEDTYNNLKAAEAKKDADGVKRLASEVSKLARSEAAAPQPSDPDQVTAWKSKVEYAKGVDTYAEYSLATMAQQPGVSPEKSVELIEELQTMNPKSKYLDARVTYAYISALQGAAGAASAKSPDRALALANKLVNTVRSRPKPEGISDADWDKLKSEALGSGYYITGAVHAQKQAWVDCDRELKNALPLINKDPNRLGPAYFYLGLCDYQFGRITQDRSKMQDAIKYSDLSAAIPGPMAAQAANNSKSIRAELAGPRK